jgi:hypothetical protein
MLQPEYVIMPRLDFVSRVTIGRLGSKICIIFIFAAFQGALMSHGFLLPLGALLTLSGVLCFFIASAQFQSPFSKSLNYWDEGAMLLLGGIAVHWISAL